MVVILLYRKYFAASAVQSLIISSVMYSFFTRPNTKIWTLVWQNLVTVKRNWLKVLKIRGKWLSYLCGWWFFVIITLFFITIMFIIGNHRGSATCSEESSSEEFTTFSASVWRFRFTQQLGIHSWFVATSFQTLRKASPSMQYWLAQWISWNRAKVPLQSRRWALRCDGAIKSCRGITIIPVT